MPTNAITKQAKTTINYKWDGLEKKVLAGHATSTCPPIPEMLIIGK